MPCRFASSGTVASSRSASRAILALNVASNFLRDLVIAVLHGLRHSRTLHTLTSGPISGGHFKTFGLVVEKITLVGRNAIENQNLLNNVQLNPSAGPRATHRGWRPISCCRFSTLRLRP